MCVCVQVGGKRCVLRGAVLHMQGPLCVCVCSGRVQEVCVEGCCSSHAGATVCVCVCVFRSGEYTVVWVIKTLKTVLS